MNKLIDKLKKAELERIHSRIYNLQKNIDNIYNDKKEKIYKFNLVNESCTYLRFLLTAFRLDLYRNLENIDKNLPIKFYNIYILHYVPPEKKGQEFGMRFYLNSDQIKRIENVYGNEADALKFKSRMYARGSRCGLAKLSMLLADRNDKKDDNIDVHIWDNWQKHEIYEHPKKIFLNFDKYEGLSEELKIYGIEEKQPSTMVVGVIPRGIEVFLLFNNKIEPDMSAEIVKVLRLGFDNLLGILSKKWDLLALDQIIYEYILSKDKEYKKTIDLVRGKIKKGLFAKRGYFKYMETYGVDGFKKFSEKHQELWNNLSKTEDASKFLKNLNFSTATKKINDLIETKTWLERKKHNKEIYYHDECQGRRDEWVKKKLFKDLGIDYMASHNTEHINNLCSLALPFISSFDECLKYYLSHLSTSIYLHDVGMGVYFSNVKKKIKVTGNQTKKIVEHKLSATRRNHSLLSAKIITEENDTKWHLKSNDKNGDLDELKRVCILTAYHVKKAPLLDDDKHNFEFKNELKDIKYLFNGGNRMLPLKEIKKEDNNSNFPYFLFVSFLRLIDSIDTQEDRAFKLGIDKLNHVLSNIESYPFLKKQPLHILKHAAIMNHKLSLVDKNKFEMKILYGPEFFMPLAIVVHGFASVIEEIYDELDRINRPAVIEKINNELSSLGLSEKLVSTGIKIEFDLFGYYDTHADNILEKWDALYD